MGYKNKEDKARYELARYYRRKSDAITSLGGKCQQCGNTENLEFDHIDPSKKSFPISSMWSVSKARLEEELKKCQILCGECHQSKSTKESTGPRDHGTHAMHRRGGCRCQKCRDFFNAYRRELRLRKKTTPV